MTRNPGQTCRSSDPSDPLAHDGEPSCGQARDRELDDTETCDSETRGAEVVAKPTEPLVGAVPRTSWG